MLKLSTLRTRIAKFNDHSVKIQRPSASLFRRYGSSYFYVVFGNYMEDFQFLDEILFLVRGIPRHLVTFETIFLSDSQNYFLAVSIHSKCIDIDIDFDIYV